MLYVDQLIDELIAREGGYVNHPNDRGGPTMWGITWQRAQAYGYSGPLQAMQKSTAATIYKQMYWAEPKFDEVSKIFPAVGAELLDTGVNMGPSVASTFLQRVLNVLNKRGSSFPDIQADGRIGKMTLFALATYKNQRGKDAEKVLLRGLECLQGAKYIGIAEANPSQEDFEFGWLLNRVGNV